MIEHNFGGSWTEIKLLSLAKYLPAYTRIFHSNERAQYFSTIYVDAFAGTGYYKPKSPKASQAQGTALLPELADPETQEFLKGSAQIALEVEPQFDRYLFIEQEQEYAVELHRLRNLNYNIRYKIEIVQAEANGYLHRVQELAHVPAAVHFLSVEPLIGPIEALPLEHIEWVIVGGESGPKARPMEKEWVVSIFRQCRRANVPFFFKQWGGVRKHLTGRTLNRRTYNEMPRPHRTARTLPAPNKF